MVLGLQFLHASFDLEVLCTEHNPVSRLERMGTPFRISIGLLPVLSGNMQLPYSVQCGLQILKHPLGWSVGNRPSAGSTVSKVRGCVPLLRKKGVSPVELDFALFIENATMGSKSSQFLWSLSMKCRKTSSITLFDLSVCPSVCG